MLNFNTTYRDYREHVAVMISTDRMIFNEHSNVRKRMIEQAKGYKELHIIVFSTTKFETQEISPNCKVYSTNSYVRYNYISKAYKIGKKIIKKIDPSLPILVSCQDPFETGLVGKKLANLRRNSELLLQIHTDLYSPYFVKHSFLNRLRILIAYFTIPYAQVIRVVSYKIGESLVKKGIDSNLIVLKPIEVDTQYIKDAIPAFDLHKKYPQFGKIVLMVSRLEPEKNIELALKAWKDVIKEIKDVGLVIVGSGRRLYRLKKMCYELKLNSSVIFEGWQSDLIPYYKGSNIFLNTSWYEGYGMVFKEAEASNLKIVSTDVGIAKEIGAQIVEWDPKKVGETLILLLK